MLILLLSLLYAKSRNRAKISYEKKYIDKTVRGEKTQKTPLPRSANYTILVKNIISHINFARPTSVCPSLKHKPDTGEFDAGLPTWS